MNIMFWNCRGINNSQFSLNVKDLISCHKPEIVILIETKLHMEIVMQTAR